MVVGVAFAEAVRRSPRASEQTTPHTDRHDRRHHARNSQDTLTTLRLYVLNCI